MAAIRSASAMLLGRCCGSCGSSAVAAMGDRGLEAQQVLRPATFRNLESWRRFSTKDREWADPKNPLFMKEKASSVLHMLWQRPKDCVKNVMEADSAKSLCVFSNSCLDVSMLFD